MGIHVCKKLTHLSNFMGKVHRLLRYGIGIASRKRAKTHTLGIPLQIWLPHRPNVFFQEREPSYFLSLDSLHKLSRCDHLRL